MQKGWYFGMVLLCLASIALSCVWLLSPTTLAAQYPLGTAAQSDYYKLVDEGGYLCILHLCEGEAIEEAVTTDIMVNLLSEADALRIKAELRVASADALATTLATLQDTQGG